MGLLNWDGGSPQFGPVNSYNHIIFGREQTNKHMIPLRITQYIATMHLSQGSETYMNPLDSNMENDAPEIRPNRIL